MWGEGGCGGALEGFVVFLFFAFRTDEGGTFVCVLAGGTRATM